MKCPKCGYTSFDYLDECKRCGTDLRDVRALLNLITVSPEERAARPPREEAATVAAAAAAEAGGEPEPFVEDLGAAPEGAEGEDILADMNFDESFEDLVERTSYEEASGGEAPGAAAAVAAKEPGEAEEEEELLDLDFGDLFGEEKPDKA